MKLVLPELRPGGRRGVYASLLGPWLPLTMFAIGIATLYAVVTLVGDGVSSGYDQYALFYCDPNGNVIYQYSSEGYADKSPYWNGNLFLSVTMGFHGLSFAQARAIDLCFDAIVGRGSQVLASLATYPIFRRAVLRSMETRELSLALLIPFFIERTSFNTVWLMVWNMRSTRQQMPVSEIEARRNKIRIDWRIILIILTGLYILALPTLMAAMTSYQARSAPFLPTNGSSGYLSTEELKTPNYIIKDGERVGLWKDYLVYDDSEPISLAACVGYLDGSVDADSLWSQTWRPYVKPRFDRLMNSSTDHSVKNKPTGINSGIMREDDMAMFDQFRKSLPSKLKVTDPEEPRRWEFTLWPRNATYSRYVTYPSETHIIPTDNDRRAPYGQVTSSFVVRNKTYHLDNELLRISLNIKPNINEALSIAHYNPIFAMDNQTFSSSQVEQRGVCLPSSDAGYIWGFSSLMLFTFCMLTILIAIFLIALHYDAYCNSSADRYKLYISPYRDVLDLAAELRACYGDTEVGSMYAKALDKAMKEDPVVARLETETACDENGKVVAASQWLESGSDLVQFEEWSRVASDQPANAEELLITMGVDPQSSEIEMGKVPAKVATRGSSSS